MCQWQNTKYTCSCTVVCLTSQCSSAGADPYDQCPNDEDVEENNTQNCVYCLSKSKYKRAGLRLLALLRLQW